jgi:uncharacterized protein (TIGR02246 family)
MAGKSGRYVNCGVSGMRHSAALALAAALTMTPAGVFAQTWVTVEAGAVAPAARDLAVVRAEHAAALNAADARRSSALYAPDAIATLGDGLVLRGREEIARYFHEALEARAAGATVTLSPQHFSVGDRVASETGSFSETRDGESSPATGVYVTIYTRDPEGEWRIAMELRTTGRDKPIVRW